MIKRFNVLGISDPAWRKIISRTFQHDFYHTWSYSCLVKQDEPVLCVAFKGDDFIAVPLIARKIKGTDFYDCTSVYGYCGPVSNLPFESLSPDHIKYFQTELLKFFKSRQFISVFIRLNPFLDQAVVFRDFGEIREINKTVAIDLRLPEDKQLEGYRESHSRRIRKLRREGYVVKDASSQAEIDAFIKIYNDSMTRLNADSYLIFSKEYFYKFLDNQCFESKVLLARKDNEITAGAVFAFTDRIIQYHLSGFKDEFRQDAPMKLIIDEARKIGVEKHMDFLHLGGGFSGSSDDSLFYFKAGFSDIRFTFSAWQLITDQSVYASLIDFFKIKIEKSDNYFPVYRSKSGKII